MPSGMIWPRLLRGGQQEETALVFKIKRQRDEKRAFKTLMHELFQMGNILVEHPSYEVSLLGFSVFPLT